MKLSTVGVWSAGFAGPDPVAVGEAAAELEDLGYGGLWYPGRTNGIEVAQTLLGATNSVIVASGILSIWNYEPAAVADAYDHFETRWPDRFLLGLGVSHSRFVNQVAPDRYQRPLAKLGHYLDELDDRQIPVHRRIIAALGPKALEQASARSVGTHPYLVTPAHTASIRAAIGPDALIATEQAVVRSTDPERARSAARTHLATYLPLANYRNNWLRGGFVEDDFAGGGSDRLVDALVAWGDLDQITARVQEHLDAGADHVCLQVFGDEGPLPMTDWRELAVLTDRLRPR